MHRVGSIPRLGTQHSARHGRVEKKRRRTDTAAVAASVLLVSEYAVQPSCSAITQSSVLVTVEEPDASKEAIPAPLPRFSTLVLVMAFAWSQVAISVAVGSECMHSNHGGGRIKTWTSCMPPAPLLARSDESMVRARTVIANSDTIGDIILNFLALLFITDLTEQIMAARVINNQGAVTRCCFTSLAVPTQRS